jgi:hypothetical protein
VSCRCRVEGPFDADADTSCMMFLLPPVTQLFYDMFGQVRIESLSLNVHTYCSDL